LRAPFVLVRLAASRALVSPSSGRSIGQVTVSTAVELLPAQQQALDKLERQVRAHHVTSLMGRPGAGKTTILRALQDRIGGAYLTTRQFIEASRDRHPLALDETVYDVLHEALSSNVAVLVDDFHLVSIVSCCAHGNPRLNLLAAALVPIAQEARDTGKRLVFATEGIPVPGVFERVPHAQIPPFEIDDYATLCTAHLSAEHARALDVRKIHRFAPNLNARQLRNTCNALRDQNRLDTDRFIDYLREHHMTSNVDLGEVQAVDLHDLKGMDDVLESLEANVILPLENTEITDELGLKAKRGVLLAGPPGTGKTTIGRALAHRLKSKFFLIDGTVVSGSPHFFQRIHHIFEAAKQNSPAIIFIDDSDVLFESGQDTGLYRFLLTMLDGLESTSAGRICLMMTAMDVGSMPPALVRSGRIELWLQTTFPDAAARSAILRDRCADLPKAIGGVDIAALTASSEGLSGADLKRVVDDGKLLFAFDRERKKQTRPSTEYFLTAIETVRRNKEQYADAEARARMRHPVRPPMFDAFSMLAGLEGADEGLGSTALTHVVFGTGTPFGSGSGSGG
jgi:ATP-dependent 26S proteasome regulatory subunit